MNIAVRYFTKSGNTAKVAEEIGKTVGAEAYPVSVSIDEPVDILFLGGSIYAFGLDDAIKAFIETLDSNTVKSVAVFSTSAIVKSGNEKMKKFLTERGIKILQPEFYCRGEFKSMRKGHPNAQDLEKAAAFAHRIMSESENR